jgi:hypothetical protein
MDEILAKDKKSSNKSESERNEEAFNRCKSSYQKEWSKALS